MKKNKKQKPPYVSDDFQIGPYGAFEYNEDDIEGMIENIDDIDGATPALMKAMREYKQQLRKKAKKSKRKGGDE